MRDDHEPILRIWTLNLTRSRMMVRMDSVQISMETAGVLLFTGQIGTVMYVLQMINPWTGKRGAFALES